MPPSREALLLSRFFSERYDARIEAIEKETGRRFERVHLPEDPQARLAPEECAKLELAYFSGDVFPAGSRALFAACHSAPRLRWLHVFNAGTDHEVFSRLFERGVTLTNSSGTSAVPIAQTAVAGLLMLARGFPHWIEAQRQRSWSSWPETPRDLADQTLLVVGLGAIGGEIARLSRALGLHVIGVRRSPEGPEDPVDELHPPSRLGELLPRVDWLALACPLTDETRGMIDSKALALLPPGACVINVGRGELLDEAALTGALRSGALGGAYLDVFEIEPLPRESPLWQMANVIITPHASSFAQGNRRREAEVFLDNLGRWARGEPLANRVS